MIADRKKVANDAYETTSRVLREAAEQVEAIVRLTKDEKLKRRLSRDVERIDEIRERACDAALSYEVGW